MHYFLLQRVVCFLLMGNKIMVTQYTSRVQEYKICSKLVIREREKKKRKSLYIDNRNNNYYNILARVRDGVS